MALTKIQSGSFETGAIDTSDLSSNATIAFSSTSAFANALAPKITTVNVANSTFTVLDDTAVNVGGGYIVITGANFQSGASVLIDTTPASAVTFVNTSILRVQIPAKAAASYNLYVVNPDGGTGIKVAGLNYSAEPSWATSSPLSNQLANTAFNVTLSATSATSYAVAAGSTLPAGTSLLANGYFSGTVSIGVETTYTFDVVATDAENQDSSKTFQVTVTVTPPILLWGAGAGQVIGLNDRVYRSSPVQIGSSIGWSSLAGAAGGVAATKSDGTLWSWGQNNVGQLGHGDIAYRSSPVQVGTGTDWSVVGGNLTTTAAVKTNGTLWLWGYNNYGQLGLNDRIDKSSPTQVGSGTDWAVPFHGKAFSNSLQSMLVTKTNGTLWAWGNNFWGNLGISGAARSSPVQVGSDTNWPSSQSKLTGTSTALFAIKTNGTLWMWGNITYFGNSAGGDLFSPTQIGSNTNWSEISGGWMHVAAIKTDGTLWTWGRNTDGGQLGHNDITTRSSPTQVGSGTDWATVRLGFGQAVAVKTNGTLWTWGVNANGNLGHNDITTRSSPVQVGSGTTWRTSYGSIAAGSAALLALRT